MLLIMVYNSIVKQIKGITLVKGKVKIILGGSKMVKIGIITGSTRDSRVNMQVAEWVESIADQRTDAEFGL